MAAAAPTTRPGGVASGIARWSGILTAAGSRVAVARVARMGA
jgi:hypothetical protein